MKQKLFTLLTLALLVCSGAWGATYDNPDRITYAKKTFLNVAGTDANVTGTDNYLCYGTLYMLNTVTGDKFWIRTSGSGGTASSSYTYSTPATGFLAANGTSGTNTYGSVNASTSREWALYFTGATSVSVLKKDNNTKDDKWVVLKLYSVASDGTETLVETKVESSPDKSNLTVLSCETSLSTSTYYKLLVTAGTSDNCAIYQISMKKAAAEKPSDPIFSPASGAIYGGSEVNITSTGATKIYYAWTSENSEPDSGDYTEATATSSKITVEAPNVSGTRYLWAKGWNTAGYSANVSSTSYTISPQPSFSFSKTTAKMAAKANNRPVTETFTIAGAYLTAGTYDFVLPSVSGLSVSPSSITVPVGGTIDEEVTITYNPSSDAVEATEDISLTIDAITKEIAVTYSASLSVYEQETVSDITVWDFMTGVTSDDNVACSTANTLYANLSGFTYNEKFAAASLKITNTPTYAYRKANKASQGAALSFTTSVPGMVTVLFAHNGSGSQYAVVNGVTGSVESTDGGNSGASAKEESFFVSAGTVTLTGSSANAIRFFKIVFQPTITATVGANGYTTFASTSPLDLTTGHLPSGLKAYKGKRTGASITFEKLNQTVPAEEGLLLLGETKGGTYYIPVAASGTTVEDNDLTGVTSPVAKQSSDPGNYYFVMKKATSASDELQFLPLSTSSAVTIPAGKAYIEVPSSAFDGPAQELSFSFDDESGDVTGISDVRSKMADVRGDFYDLSGRKVAQPKKGLYIVNGKKVIVK